MTTVGNLLGRGEREASVGAGAPARDFSRITERTASWGSVRRLIRQGDSGRLVPVVIPKDRRGYGWIVALLLALYFVGAAIAAGGGAGSVPGILLGLLFLGLAGVLLWRAAVVEIEQGTTGVLTVFGEISRILEPGRHWLLWPWQRVAFVVDTSTEIPYSAPVLSSPTRENVPLKSIEFFLKFQIVEPVMFVRTIGAGNFDVVLSSAVQDAIRRRSRRVQTERAYDLRGSDVGDMQEYLNRQMERYGVRILGANIPDVQLPDQYRLNLATRETVAKELSAYEKEWELTRKQRTDALLLEIERAKKVRDARRVEVREALNRAREDVAQMLQEQQTAAERVRLEIEADGRAKLAAAENEARALEQLGESYRDNWAVVRYELARERLAAAEELARSAPRPFVVRGGTSEGREPSALATLLLARMLPDSAGARADAAD